MASISPIRRIVFSNFHFLMNGIILSVNILMKRSIVPVIQSKLYGLLLKKFTIQVQGFRVSEFQGFRGPGTRNLEPGTSLRRGFGWQSPEPAFAEASAGKARNLEPSVFKYKKKSLFTTFCISKLPRKLLYPFSMEI